MALDFPNSPTNGQIYTDPGTGEQWLYESATNSWTSRGLVNTSGGLQFKGSLDITAVPPTGVSAGWQYSSTTTGTPNAGFTGLSGTVNKGDVVMYTGTGWILQSHTVPDATAVVKGIDTQKWTRTGTELSPATAGDSVFTSGSVKVGGTTAAPNLQIKADGGIVAPNTFSIATAGSERVRIDSTGKLLVGASSNIIARIYSANVQSNGFFAYQASHFAADAAGPLFYFLKSRNPTAGSHTVVTANDVLGRLAFAGSDGTGFVEGAFMEAVVDGTPSANSVPGRIVLSTSAAGASSPTARMTIKSTGVINFSNVPTYADNTAATTGGLVVGDVYRTSTGQLMIRY